MFFQQPFRVQASSIRPQEVLVNLESSLRQHYTTKAMEYNTNVARVLRVDVLNSTAVGSATQVDVVLSVEADTIDFFNQFVHSFITEEDTESMRITPM